VKAGYLLVSTLIALGAAPASLAVIFYSTADATYNTTAPTGPLSGSGWQWVGSIDGYPGTPIGPHHFLAAKHIGGLVGDTYTFDGIPYRTSAYYDDPSSDLRIWQVEGFLPAWAPIYRGSAEVGQGLVVFGSGLSRGAEVRDTEGTLNGWMWGSGGGVQRWGQNSVQSVVDAGAGYGDVLYSVFSQFGGANECDLANEDSSSPVFINDGSGWKLAGIALSVDSFFSVTDSGNGFVAALFDARGLYYDPTPPNGWALVTGSAPVPSGFYTTRVSVHASWIDSIVPPEDTDVPALSPLLAALLAAVIVLIGAAYLSRRQRRIDA
jgi:hypothetical protein